MIVYGAMTGTSIGKLFIAGIIPGIILTTLYSTHLGITLALHPEKAPPREQIPLKRCLLQTMGAWPMILLIFCVLGSIYLGIATPTEAASVGCMGVLAVAASLKLLNLKILRKITREAVQSVSMVLLVLMFAKVLGVGIGVLKVSDQLLGLVTDLDLNRYIVLGIIYLMYIFLGMVMDSLAAIVITLPITFPILVGLGFDPVWVGIAIVSLDELGLITPPVGLNLYILQGLRPNYSFSEIIMGSIPPTLLILLNLTLLTIFPKLATFLPTTMFAN